MSDPDTKQRSDYEESLEAAAAEAAGSTKVYFVSPPGDEDYTLALFTTAEGEIIETKTIKGRITKSAEADTEARELRAAVEDTLAAVESARRQMQSDQIEIDSLRDETRWMLSQMALAA